MGGLSVLRDLWSQLPNVNHVYVADTAFAPYGERDVAAIEARSHVIAEYLRHHHRIDALVIACNTATAHAIDALRARHPDLPIVGVEPALKPASGMSASGHVGVLATRGTLSSQRFERLRRQVESQSAKPLFFWPQACDGLADAIERDSHDEVQALCQRYVASMLEAGPQAHRIDTIVLGCTHYPFAIDALQAATQTALPEQQVLLLDTGLPVAKRARELLTPLMLPVAAHRPAAPPILLSTGNPAALSNAARRWISSELTAFAVAI